MAVKPVEQLHPVSSASKKNRTLRLRGFIDSREVLILLDSGSAGTFISQEIASLIVQPKISCEPLKFTTTDGQTMIYDTMIPQMLWTLQGHSFSHNTRVLPL
jgi:hypothetical protein